ncbi:MAG: hypothetical protein COB42_08620 [Sulfurimonas sp.]|nr:MAG: hypothetical protein COB42_08925 [Sulfurimonas sp.]PHQ88534.1 MAG: hypothetical protein COB42_08620 [Sulfurimonas sp.]
MPLGGDDSITTGSGADTLIGGAGNDTYVFNRVENIELSYGYLTDKNKSHLIVTLAVTSFRYTLNSKNKFMGMVA